MFLKRADAGSPFSPIAPLLLPPMPVYPSENLRLVAEYFQGTESMGGPTRDWMGIYDECCT